jgi:DNA-binding beta-propeller fold protein YncE
MKSIWKRAAMHLAIGLAAASLLGCEAYEEPAPPRDRLHFPLSVAVHPTGDVLYVVNSNFDTRYRQDIGGTIAVMDADTGNIIENGTPYVGSFGGQLSLNANATRAYIPTRFENTITIFEVAEDGRAIFCRDDSGRPTANPENCAIRRIGGDDEVGGTRIPADPFGLDLTTVPGTWRVVDVTEPFTLRVVVDGRFVESYTGNAGEIVDALVATGNYAAAAIDGGLEFSRTDGSAVAVREADLDGGTVATTTTDIAHLAHLRATQVTTIAFPGQDPAAASLQTAPITAGSNALAQRPGSSDVYVVGRGGADIVIYRPYIDPIEREVQAIFERGTVRLNHLSSTIDGRGIAWNEAGDRFYTVTRRPDALHIVDVVPDDLEEGTGTRHVLTRTIPLPKSPTGIVLHESIDGPLLYIPCLEAESIQVVDPISEVVVADIPVGDSPSEFAVNEARCETPDGCVGYVSLFNDQPTGKESCGTDRLDECGSVGVIDLDPTSPRYHQIIRKF